MVDVTLLFTLVMYHAVIEQNRMIAATENTVMKTDHPNAEISPVLLIPFT